MQIREVMTHGVEVVGPDATLQEAARTMERLDIGSVPVCDGERLVGMLTDRDITVRATAEGRDPASTPVRDIMTQDVLYCFEDDDIQAAAETMQRAQIRRLVVLDRSKRLVGFVSLGDLAISPQAKDEASEALEEISEPATPAR